MLKTEARVILERITREKSATIFDHLFELDAYEVSEQMPLQLKARGRFELTPVAIAAGRRLADKSGEELAGFALVRAGSRVTGSPDVMDVAEFFVLRGARRRGLGMSAAHALFSAFPRVWEVRVRRTNVAALEFWSRTAEAWVRQPVVSSPFRAEGVDWDVLRFATGSG